MPAAVRLASGAGHAASPLGRPAPPVLEIPQSSRFNPRRSCSLLCPQPEYPSCGDRFLLSFSSLPITLGRESLTPRFIDLDYEDKTPTLVERFLLHMANVFESEVLSIAKPGDSRPRGLPLEVKHFLDVMRSPGSAKLLPLVLYHPCLVPVENWCDYFDRIHGHLRQVLKQMDRPGYDHVVENLIFHEDWDNHLRSNAYLKQFYDDAPPGTEYDPKGLCAVGAVAGRQLSAKQQGDARKAAAGEVIRFTRNVPAHGLELARNPAKLHFMSFNRTDMGRMLSSTMHGILCSAAESLAKMNHFVCLELASLFPGRVVTK